MTIEVDTIEIVPRQPAAAAVPAVGRSKLYLGGWIGLAVAALGYLTVAAAKPELLADLSDLATRVGTERIAAAGAAPADPGEVLALRDTAARLQAEVSRLTANVIASEERAGQLAERLAALEPRSATQAAASADSAASDIARKFADAKPAAKAEAKPVASAGLKVLNQPADGIETGSIAAPHATAAAAPAAATPAQPIAFGAAVVTPAPRPMGVQIANAPSIDALRLSWSLLTERHADSLKSLEPRYVMGAPGGNADGESFDLVAGPFKTEAQAKRACKTLQARGVPCRIADYEGNAL